MTIQCGSRINKWKANYTGYPAPPYSWDKAERAKMRIAKWLRLIFTLLTTACIVCGVFGAILHWYLLPMFWLVGTGPFSCLLHIGKWIEENKV